MRAWLAKAAVMLASVGAVAGCSTAAAPPSAAPPDTEGATSAATPTPATTPPPSVQPIPPAVAAPPPTPQPAQFDTTSAGAIIETLARDIGPREATGAGFAAAVTEVERRFSDLGYAVVRQPVSVPAGESWGVAVPAGDTVNVLASTSGADPSRPYLVVGAHLDTVPQAPGAVDNASGIAVMLEVARMAALEPPPQPVVFVAFGAEEPRGPGDGLHHFGSQAFVAQLGPQARDALVGAIAIDSVGIIAGVPICSATGSTDAFTLGVRDAAQQAGVPVRACENRTSDHWSFVRNGLDGVRVGLAGEAEYAEYHSPADTPAVVDDALVAQAGQAVWAAVSRRW